MTTRIENKYSKFIVPTFLFFFPPNNGMTTNGEKCQGDEKKSK
jgi:hypothetical protein